MGLENIVPVRAARHVHIGGKKALLHYLKQVALFGGGATVTISAVMAIAPELWLRLVFGTEYQGYGGLLQGFAAIYILIFAIFVLKAGLKAIEQNRAIFMAAIWASLFSVPAAFPLTEHFGLAGVIGGIVTIFLIQLLIQGFGLKKALKEMA